MDTDIMSESTSTGDASQASPLLFSIIIPSYNSVTTLIPLLESLQRQTITQHEVILVDDASTDDTKIAVAAYDVQYHRMAAQGGPASARNYGATLALAPWLVFADADTIFADDTLEKIKDALEQCPMDALVGTYSGRPANAGFMPRYKAMWEALAIDAVLESHGEKYIPYTAWAPRPGVVRKEVFEAVGGFNESFRGADLEDVDLGYRLTAAGYAIFFVPAVRIQHHYPATFRKEIRAFARRCALWMQMKREHGFFDAAGEGTPRQALVHIDGFAAFLLLVASILFPWLLAPAAVLTLVYFFTSRRFILFALKEEGLWFALLAALVCWIHTIVLGVAASYGLMRRFLGNVL